MHCYRYYCDDGTINGSPLILCAWCYVHTFPGNATFSCFLANLNSCLRSLYAVARPSVIRLSSVMLVHPTPKAISQKRHKIGGKLVL